jgi:hypothetical protein
MTQPIPFHLTLESSRRLTCRVFAVWSDGGQPNRTEGYPYPADETDNGRCQVCTPSSNIPLRPINSCDLRNTLLYGVKTDMWRVDCIGDANFTLVVRAVL